MKNIITYYYRFFDEKLENGTIIICIIGFLIILVGVSINPQKEIFYTKTNLMEIKK